MKVELVNSVIEALEAINPTDVDAYTQALQSFEKLGQIPFLILDFPDLPLNVFHTRTHETDDKFTKISDVELPPAQFVKNYGRCNVPNQPVFYCSDYRPTSYMELLQYWLEDKKDEMVHATVSKWTVNNSLKVLIVTSPLKEDRVSEYDKVHGHALDYNLKLFDEESAKAYTIFYKFLFEKFRKPAKKDLLTYLITAAYSNLAFKARGGAIDAIMYPSVPSLQADAEGLNIAFKHTYDFKNNLKPVLLARDSFKREGMTLKQENHIQAKLIKDNGEIFWD